MVAENHAYIFRLLCNTILLIFVRFFFSGNCSPDQITCKDGQCIGKKDWLCDGNTCPHNKCDDHSDEDKQICGKFLFSIELNNVRNELIFIC